MNTRIVIVGLVLGLTGCSRESEQSRMVPPGQVSKILPAEDDQAVTKSPRRIATH